MRKDSGSPPKKEENDVDEVTVPQFDVKLEEKEKTDLDLGKEESSEDDQPEKEEDAKPDPKQESPILQKAEQVLAPSVQSSQTREMVEIKAKLEIGSQRQDEFSFNGGNMPIKNS